MHIHLRYAAHYEVPRVAIYFNEIWRFVKSSARSKPTSSTCIVHPRLLTEYFLDLVPKNPHISNLDCATVYYVRPDYYASKTSVFDTFLSTWHNIILCMNRLPMYRPRLCSCSWAPDAFEYSTTYRWSYANRQTHAHTLTHTHMSTYIIILS